MINIQNPVDCCGCNACGDICPKDAITFETDIEGFWYPKVNLYKCIDCGLCEKVCPIINIDSLKKNDLEQSICYAAEHKDLEVVFDSTSGGLFSALADITYKDKGYVGGAIFNDDFSVKQYISSDKHDLPKLRSSKYVESNLEGFYQEVKSLLIKGEKVLICGCPCQMSAMRAFLRKDYDNLIIADFICLGINSPKVWKKYLDSFTERYGSKVIYSKAKSKEYGWRNLTQKVILENGETHYETKDQSNYTQGYIRTHAYARPSCYECRFKGFPRISDITLADFWGIENVDKSMEKNLGTSLVMINSKKGETFFEKVKSRINYVQVPFESILNGNPALQESLSKPNVDRTEFFSDLDKMTFTQIAAKYIHKKPVGVRVWLSSLRKDMKYYYEILRTTRLHIKPIYQLFKYNSIKEIIRKDIILPTPYCIIDIDKSAKISKHGMTIIGTKIKFPKSKKETLFHVGSNANLELHGDIKIGYGADIEVFDNASLTIGKNVFTNLYLTLICGDRISIGSDTMIGRNVTIRDNNGGHYINRKGYKNSAPVIIGEKCWLCEQCVIMNGVKVGNGAIVGAKSFVVRNVPSYTMVSGHPAEVVDEDVLWKY